MQEKRHDRVVEMRLCFFLGKVGDYNVSFVETRMCRSTAREEVQRLDTIRHNLEQHLGRKIEHKQEQER